MLPRLTLVIALFAFIPVAHAQFLPGSMIAQTCPYPNMVAPGAYNALDAQLRHEVRKQSERCPRSRDG